MITLEKKLALIHFFAQKERALSTLTRGVISADHKANAEALAEIYMNLSMLNE